jgi:hypothetical protein
MNWIIGERVYHPKLGMLDPWFVKDMDNDWVVVGPPGGKIVQWYCFNRHTGERSYWQDVPFPVAFIAPNKEEYDRQAVLRQEATGWAPTWNEVFNRLFRNPAELVRNLQLSTPEVRKQLSAALDALGVEPKSKG